MLLKYKIVAHGFQKPYILSLLCVNHLRCKNLASCIKRENISVNSHYPEHLVTSMTIRPLKEWIVHDARVPCELVEC